MKATKKLLAILLLLSMFAFALLGCQSDPADGNEDESGDASADPERDENAPEVKDFNGYTYTIRNDAWDDYEVAAPQELNGQGINDVVYERNKKVEREYNITIAENGDPGASSSSAQQFLQQMANSGDYYADLYSYYARYMISSHVTAGYFRNIYDLDGLNLSADWWDQSFIEAMTISKHAYTLTGSIQTNDELHQLTLATNHSLFVQNFPDQDLYEIVMDGKWTHETFIGLWQGFGQDTGATGKVDLEDKIGFCYAAGICSFVYASDMKTFTMENGEPVLNLQSEKALNFTDMYEAMFSGGMDAAEFGGSIGGSVQLDYDLRSQHFSGGNMLFTTFLFHDALQYLDMEDELFYLPYPKYDEEQKEYMTPMQPFFEPLAVSANVLDTERTALITEALAYYSDSLQEEVVDILLQERLTHEVKPRELLILTFDSMCYDMDYIANISGYDSKVQQMVQRGSFETYSSDMKSLESTLIKSSGKGTLQMFIKKYVAH